MPVKHFQPGAGMAAKQSAETKHAMNLYLTKGKSIVEAAYMADIHPSTLRRALAAAGEYKFKKRVDRSVRCTE